MSPPCLSSFCSKFIFDDKTRLVDESGLTGSMRKPERGKKLPFQTLPSPLFPPPVREFYGVSMCDLSTSYQKAMSDRV